jgi:TetR/AcrR family transcriptional regulator
LAIDYDDPQTPKRESADTRTSILDAAERSFAQLGLSGARTDIIAAEVGITAAMINYYFGSKNKLYTAVLDRVYQERAEGLDPASLQAMPAKLALGQYVERLLKQLMEKPHIAPLFALESLQNSGRYFGTYRTATSLLVDILQRGIDEGVFHPLDPRQTAINVMGVCIHYFNVVKNMRVLWPDLDETDDELARGHAVSALRFIMKAVIATDDAGLITDAKESAI